jgi:hypothetical protein
MTPFYIDNQEEERTSQATTAVAVVAVQLTE